MDTTLRCFQRCTILSLALALLLAQQQFIAESPPFETGPLNSVRMTAAARRAGFNVRDLKADMPVAVRPRLSHPEADYADDSLVALRGRYPLEKLAAEGRDEWHSQLLLKEWVHKTIPGGSPKISYNNALEILEHAARG